MTPLGMQARTGLARIVDLGKGEIGLVLRAVQSTWGGADVGPDVAHRAKKKQPHGLLLHGGPRGSCS